MQTLKQQRRIFFECLLLWSKCLDFEMNNLLILNKYGQEYMSYYGKNMVY